MLFLLFINDLLNAVPNDTLMALYADDTKLRRGIRSLKDYVELKKTLASVETWSVKNLTSTTILPNVKVLLSLAESLPYCSSTT